LTKAKISNRAYVKQAVELTRNYKPILDKLGGEPITFEILDLNDKWNHHDDNDVVARVN
jgi:hypothetical protein